MSKILVNSRTGEAVATAVEIADTRQTRNRGLLGRDSIPASTALMLSPCFSIHTAFMRFAIDAVFVDREGTVVRIVREMPAWRVAASWRARAVIEIAAGAAARHDVRVGDRLVVAA